jgi:hypothetical protein
MVLIIVADHIDDHGTREEQNWVFALRDFDPVAIAQ